ncbi:MAG: hypothetical protein ACTSYF_01795, partial [Promethearchaeota archaeon]
ENFTDLQASVQLLEKVGKFYHLPIENAYSDTRINEISDDLENKRKALEEELDSFQPKVKLSETDKSLYI